MLITWTPALMHRRNPANPHPHPHSTQEFFTKLCADTTAMAFDIEDLATSASTRAVRNLNLGARISATIRGHEQEVNRWWAMFVHKSMDG